MPVVLSSGCFAVFFFFLESVVFRDKGLFLKYLLYSE
jgi:hypothetical protein